MTMIRCSECGRSVSDQAAACVGCGAPITPAKSESSFLIAPAPSIKIHLTQRQLRWRLALSSATFLCGIIAASRAQSAGGNRIAATVAGVVLISGLCWMIVAVLQVVMARK